MKRKRRKIVFDPFGFVHLFFLKIRLRTFDIPRPSTVMIFLLSLMFFLYSSSLVIQLVFEKLPTADDLINRHVPATTKIYDRNGILLYKIYRDENRTPVKLSQIPTHVQLATLAIEDAEFYKHPGFSLRGIARSVIKNIREGKAVGGSTITQQLVKNALLSPEKTLLRKVREIIISIKVEIAFSKEEILEMYLNEVSYGNSAYGIEEAARVYFGKTAQNLTLGEGAFLAGLPKSPTHFSPFGQNPEAGRARQREVLSLMQANGFITPQQVEEAANQELVFAAHQVEIKAPHFVMYVKEQLVEKYGEEMVEQGGLEVTTTLDYNIQLLAEEVVKKQVDKLAGLHVTNGSAVVLHPTSGEILAMVGSYDYFDTKRDGNVNVALRLRSPGSSIKAVTYAYALSHGFTPATIIPDTPLVINIPGQKPYTPKNYDNGFRGNLSLRSALAESRNIPAVRTIQSIGVKNMIALGREMGITTWEAQNRFGPSLTLGGGEVKLIDLARVYATIANGGKRPEILSIAKVKNNKGDTLDEQLCSSSVTATCKSKQVLDPRVSFMLIDILKDNVARSPAFGSLSSLVISNHPEVAVKTGTSNDLRDNLTVGFSQKYLVAVWVGNNDNSPMGRIASGITGAAPIWNQIMTALLAKEESQEWPIPSKLVKLFSGCPTREEWFLEENQQIIRCPSSPAASPSPTPSGQKFRLPRIRLFN